MLNGLKSNWLQYYAVSCSVCISIVIVYCGTRWLQDSFSYRPLEQTDEKAIAHYLSKFKDAADRRIANGVLRKASRCYVRDGGTYAGERWFWTCTLDSEESCFQLLRQTPFEANLSGRPLELSKMVPYFKDDLFQGIVGPLQYQSGEDSASVYWFPHLVERGCYFLKADGDRYYMFLIDLDRCRVYECYQSCSRKRTSITHVAIGVA